MSGFDFSLRHIAMYLIAFLLAVTVHEFAHARAALSAGDETAKRMGRVSLNPIDHLDPVGTVFFIATVISGFGIAWGKPVPVNPGNFKSPRWDSLRVSIWGPVSNLITAVVLTLILRFAILRYAPAFYDLVTTCILFNLLLAFFNMIPIPPLDGSKVLSSLLPIDSARSYDLTMARYGMVILILMLIVRIPGHGNIIGMIIGPPLDHAYDALMRLATWHNLG